ncbi:MAG TPA: hypothetical protein VIH61_04720, partial [Waddliaceae bacterium]
MSSYGTFSPEILLSREISKYLSESHRTPESCSRRSGRFTIQVGGALLSYASLVPALLVLDGFTPLPQSPVWTKAFQVFAKASLFICFGTFGAFGYVKLGNHIFFVDSSQLKDSSDSKSRRCGQIILKIAHVGASLLMGFVSRLPGVGVASLVNARNTSESALLIRVIGEVIAGVGTAGPECLSAYLALGALGKQFDRVFAGKDYEKRFQIIRRNVCDAIVGLIQRNFVTLEVNRDRLKQLLNVYSSEESPLQLGAKEVKELFALILTKENLRMGRNRSTTAQIVCEVGIAAITSYAAMILLLQNTILSRLAIDSWQEGDAGWKWPC